MMYILLLIYFVNLVTGDDSSEAKYIDLLPEKEKEDFLETVARRIFDNIKHKNAIPEKDEHTKLIEKVFKEESLNLKRVSQNTSDDYDGKGNVVEEGVDALDLTQEGKRNKRNSLKENKNSNTVTRVQQVSQETNVANFNELSKELGVSDTEDIEVKHTSNKQTEVNNEEISTENNLEGIEAEITVGDLISKENSSVRDDEGKTTKSPSSTSNPEEIRVANEKASESIETAKTEHSNSHTEIINATSKINEPTNDWSEKDTEQEPVAITVKTSLSTSPNVKFTEPTSEEAVENNATKGLATNAGIKVTKSEEMNVVLANAITKIVTTNPEIKASESTTELSKLNETRKAYDKLASNFDIDNITLDNIRDHRDNEGTKAIIDETLTTKIVITANNVKLDKKYFDDKIPAAAVDENQNHTSLNHFAISIEENYQPVTEKNYSTNSVTESDSKYIKLRETIVNGTNNSNKTLIKVIKNCKDCIKNNHSITETAVNDYNGTILENNLDIMAQNNNVIAESDPEMITTTTMGTQINNNQEINIENSTEKTHNKSTGITDGIYTDATMESNKMRNDPEIVASTSKEIILDRDIDSERKDNTAEVPEINNNKTDANYEKVKTESINIIIKHDNPAEKTKSSSAEIRSDMNVTEKNTIENNEGTTSETYIESTTVKMETITVATDIYKSKANDKDFKIKEDVKPYINQEKNTKTPIPKTNQDAVILFDNVDNKMEKNIEKMEKISANFVNDMIKVIRASFSDKPNEALKPLRLLNDNPKPEYKVYKAPNNETFDQDYGAKDDKVIEENPYYVPVYNYGPEHAYYNPKNRQGPNADDDDVTLIKNDGLNVESIAHNYDSIVKDNGYSENDYMKNYNQNRHDSNDNDDRNDIDYDEAYNKEREFIDRMGHIKENNILTMNENLRGRDTDNTQKLKKVEYMKNLVKIYKNRDNKNSNKQRSFGRYKLNLPIVVNYPKYSDIIMNSHDYIDVDYRYPAWNKPKHSRNRKHQILRANENKFPKDLIITSFADDPDSEQENAVGVTNSYAVDEYNDMLSVETLNQEMEKPYKIIYDDDLKTYVKKPLQNHYGKPNSINLFESEESVWETQDTKAKRNKKNSEDEKSFGVKNQIQKIREMMYSAANFGSINPKQLEENKYDGLKDFINKVPKKCHDEDPSCVEPFMFIRNNHMHNRKQIDSGRDAINNSIASNYFVARTNNASDSVVDYVPKLSARTKNLKIPTSDKFRITDHFHRITWINDFSEIQDKRDKSNCSFCTDYLCHICVCGLNHKFCIIPEYESYDNNEVDMTTPTEESTDENFPNTENYYTDTVKNISMLPSYLDPILKNKNEENKLNNQQLKKNRKKNRKQRSKKNKKKIFRSRSDKLPLKNYLRDEDKSSEDINVELHDAKPNIIKLYSTDQLKDPDDPNPPEEYKTIDTQTDEKPEITSHSQKKKYNRIKTIQSIMEIIPDDVELMLKVTAMLENQNSDEKEGVTEEKESQFLRSIESIDLESYVMVLQDMVHSEKGAQGLVQYDWMGTSIDIQAAIFKLKEMTESVKKNEVLDNLDFKLLKYFTFLHKFSTKRQNDLRMFLPKPKYRYNRTRSQKGVYSRTWLKRRLKKFAFEVSGTDLYYFVEFLEELQFYLYDLHTALTQIAKVTSYKNQHWFKNLAELYLDSSRKNILALLLHITTVRLLDLVENSVQSGLQDGFLKYVINNEKEIEKSKDEFVLILKIVEELKKTQ